MKLATIRVMFVCIVVFMFGYFAYSRRFEISAGVWHWRNGGFAHVGDYMMPVPDGWLVKVEPSGLTFLTDARNRRNIRALNMVNVITVDSLPTSTRNLESWKSSREQWLKTTGVGDPEQKSLRIGDEAVACVGGHELHDLMQLPDTGEVFSVDCRSSGRLHLMFVGQKPDLGLFYTLIPQIHKQQ